MIFLLLLSKNIPVSYTHLYAVSLEDLEENPLIDTDEDIANVSEDENSFDGAANTAAIMNFAIKDLSLIHI